MKTLLSIAIGLIIAASAHAGPSADQIISTDLTAQFVESCQEGKNAYRDFEKCLAGATAARDSAVRTANEIKQCLTLPAADQGTCLENINQ